MKHQQPDFIIEECVPGSLCLVEGLTLFLGRHWDVRTFNLEPSMFGDPQSGMRHYTVYRNMSKRFKVLEVPHPLQLFRSTMLLDMSVYFCGSDTDVRQALEVARVAGGFSRYDETVGWKDTLPPAHHKRLLQFIASDLANSIELLEAFFTDQSGRSGICTGPMHRRLLRSTIPYHFTLQRLQLPLEAMVQMGMPAMTEPWHSFISQTNPAVVRELAGNALHPRMFATIFLSTLASL